VQTSRELSKLICGSYDLEILCLPRVIVKGVKINQSHTTTVKIEEPGAVSFILGAAGVTSVFAEEGKQLTWVCNLSETATQDMVRLQPGRYKAVYRAKGARETMFSLEKSFQVLPGTSQQVIMK
jgi:Ca-activated chloride channel family protein